MPSSPTPQNSQSPDTRDPHKRSRQKLLIGSTIALLGVLIWVGISQLSTNTRPLGAASLQAKLSNSHETVYVIHQPSGEYIFRVTRLTGPPMDLTPQQFASRAVQDQHASGLFSKFLNITSPMGMIWVGVGLLGQVLFTGRMVVQWLASEKQHQSVVPSSFWWMSLIGATMLLVYFVWRKDVVGVLGQSAGWFIYVRNLWLIYETGPLKPADSPATTAVPAAEGN